MTAITTSSEARRFHPFPPVLPTAACDGRGRARVRGGRADSPER